MNKIDFIPPLLAIIEQENNKSPNKKLIQALEFFYTHNISYIDCYLHCLSTSKSLSLASFNAKLIKQK